MDEACPLAQTRHTMVSLELGNPHSSRSGRLEEPSYVRRSERICLECHGLNQRSNVHDSCQHINFSIWAAESEFVAGPVPLNGTNVGVHVRSS